MKYIVYKLRGNGVLDTLLWIIIGNMVKSSMYILTQRDQETKRFAPGQGEGVSASRLDIYLHKETKRTAPGGDVEGLLFWAYKDGVILLGEIYCLCYEMGLVFWDT